MVDGLGHLARYAPIDVPLERRAGNQPFSGKYERPHVPTPHSGCRSRGRSWPSRQATRVIMLPFRTRSCGARAPWVSRRPGAQLQDLLPDQPSDALDLMILQRFVYRHLHSGRRVFRAGRSRPRPVEQFHRGTRVDMHWRDIDASSDAAPHNRVALRNVGAVLVVHVRTVRRRVGYHDAGCCSEQDRCPITGPETTKSDRSS